MMLYNRQQCKKEITFRVYELKKAEMLFLNWPVQLFPKAFWIICYYSSAPSLWAMLNYIQAWLEKVLTVTAEKLQ